MAFYRERDLKQFTKEVTSEGIGIGGGFIAGGLVGRQVENILVKEPVDEFSPISKKLLAWAANNGAKFALYWLAKRYDAGSEITKEATKALAGSVVYDTVLRIANKGYNPAEVYLAGYRVLGANGTTPANVQKLVQENSLLRTELNKALQRLAGVASDVQIRQMPANPDKPGDFKYGASTMDPYERQRRYGSMPVGIDSMPIPPGMNAMPTSPAVSERQRKYGSMPFEQPPDRSGRQRRYGFSAPTEENSMYEMFGML